MYKKRFTKDISSKDGTIGKVFSDHRDELMECRSIEALRLKVEELFVNGGIDTPKSRQIKLKLGSMSLNNGLIYVQNVLFASMGMGTY